jgi:hypothetical protein
MSLADLVSAVVPYEPPPVRRYSDTPQARWNRENAERMNVYRRNWRKRRKQQGRHA